MATGRIATLIRMPERKYPYYNIHYNMPDNVPESVNQATFTPEAILGIPSVILEILA